jgi:integrase
MNDGHTDPQHEGILETRNRLVQSSSSPRHQRVPSSATASTRHHADAPCRARTARIQSSYLERSPFKIGTEAAISLDREIPRNWRFASEEDEQKPLDACNPHLRAIVVAMLDTACRPGELLSLQWRDVNLARKELTVRAEKAKTRTERLIPISTRLHAILEMRKVGPDGADAFVFGDATGAQVKSVRTAWENARTTAGLTGLQLRDLRHEAGSRFEEAGVAVVYVSKLLGHTNLSTTSRYLNIHRRGLHAAMEKLEAHRPAVAQPLHKREKRRSAHRRNFRRSPASKPSISIS